jgi:hypothetical protein
MVTLAQQALRVLLALTELAVLAALVILELLLAAQGLVAATAVLAVQELRGGTETLHSLQELLRA